MLASQISSQTQSQFSTHRREMLSNSTHQAANSMSSVVFSGGAAPGRHLLAAPVRFHSLVNLPDSQLEWPGSNRPLLYELRQAGIGKHQLNKRLLTAALVGSFGGFIFGYDLGALSASTQSLRGQWHLSPAAFGLTVASSLWGTVCGALLSGRMADRVDRPGLIARCSILYALAAIGIAVPIPSPWILVPAMRFLAGMSVGGFTVACPLYLSEIAPVALRGRLVSLFQVQVGAGVLVAFFVGLVVAHLAATGTE